MDTAQTLQAWPLPQLAACQCGRRHAPATGMPPVYLGPGVLAQADRALSPLGAGPFLVVADVNTATIATELSGYLMKTPHRVHVLSYPVEASEETVHQLTPLVDSDIRGLVAVGSGSLTDVVRLAAYRSKLPFVSVTTAPSMDGYLSWGAPIVVEGYKLTYHAQGPAAVISDTAILSAAPPRLIRSGFGDILGKYTSLADWRIGHLLTHEYWCPALADSVVDTLTHCDELATIMGTDPAVAAPKVMDALFVTGHAMICVGNSRPASGSEHHMSHYWEMRALAEGKTHALHGEQVGVTCVLSAAIYHELLARPVLAVSEQQWKTCREKLSDIQARQARVQAGFGTAAARLLQETPEKDAFRLAAMNVAEVNAWWQQCRRALDGAIPQVGTLLRTLRKAGAPASPSDLHLSPQWVHDAIIYARELRPRLTILDVAAAAGFLEVLAEKLAQESVHW